MKNIGKRIRRWEQKHSSFIELVVAIVMLLATIITTTGFGAYYISKSATISSPIYEMDTYQYQVWANTIKTVRKKPGAYLSTNE